MDVKRVVSKIVAEHETRNPFDICKNLSIYVLYHHLFEMRGFLQIEDGVKIIHLADDLSDIATEFVCAHELGHSILHAGLNRVFMDRRTFMEPTRFENRADHFAAQLLWGGAPLYREQAIMLYEMADALNVPEYNVNSRLLELGIYH